MSINSIAKRFAETVEYLENGRFNGTFHWHIDTDDNGNDWAIVMAYMDYDGDGERLYAKLACKPSDSVMWCDYDVDWLMPYDEDSGEVYDTELPINSPDEAKRIVNWMFEYYDDLKEKNIIKTEFQVCT